MEGLEKPPQKTSGMDQLWHWGGPGRALSDLKQLPASSCLYFATRTFSDTPQDFSGSCHPQDRVMAPFLAPLASHDPAPTALPASFLRMLQQCLTPRGFLMLFCNTAALCLYPSCSFGLKLETKNTLPLAILTRPTLLFALLRKAGGSGVGLWSRARGSVSLWESLWHGPHCGGPEKKWRMIRQVCWK